MRDPIPAAAVAGRVPWWAWIGGFFGAVFKALAIVLVSQLGTATFVVILITGQMIVFVTFNHFGWLGLARGDRSVPSDGLPAGAVAVRLTA